MKSPLREAIYTAINQ